MDSQIEASALCDGSFKTQKQRVGRVKEVNVDCLRTEKDEYKESKS